MTSGKIETQSTAAEVQRTGRNSLTVTDNRTGKTYELPITDDTIRALDLRHIKVNSEDFGMMSYDPAFNNTALCRSKITFIDGDAGILRYRGYPIEEKSLKTEAGNKTTSKVELLEISEAPLNPSLFELPAGYRQALRTGNGGADLRKPDTVSNRAQYYWTRLVFWVRGLFR